MSLVIAARAKHSWNRSGECVLPSHMAFPCYLTFFSVRRVLPAWGGFMALTLRNPNAQDPNLIVEVCKRLALHAAEKDTVDAFVNAGGVVEFNRLLHVALIRVSVPSLSFFETHARAST